MKMEEDLELAEKGQRRSSAIYAQPLDPQEEEDYMDQSQIYVIELPTDLEGQDLSDAARNKRSHERKKQTDPKLGRLGQEMAVNSGGQQNDSLLEGWPQREDTQAQNEGEGTDLENFNRDVVDVDEFNVDEFDVDENDEGLIDDHRRRMRKSFAMSRRESAAAELFDGSMNDVSLIEAAMINSSSRDFSLGESSRGAYAVCLGRPEFLSSTIYKNVRSDPVGINMHDRGSKLLVTSIVPHSLLYDSPFHAGDVMHSINNKECANMDRHSASDLIRNTAGYVTIVVRNPNERRVCDLLEAMITKETPDAKLGIKFGGCGLGDIQISEIIPTGSFAQQSLVNVGDQLVKINGEPTYEMSVSMVASIIRRAPKFVTIVVRTQATTGSVVAELSATDIDVNVPTVSAVLPESEETAESPANDLTPEISAQRKIMRPLQYILPVVFIVLLFAFMTGVFSN